MKRILILEDETPLSKATDMALSRKGYASVSVPSVQDAMALLDSGEKFDAIWLDHYLLGAKTGLDFLAEIRNSSLQSKIPVFVVTNSISEDKTSSYEVLGIERYFVKAESRLSDIIKDIDDYFDKRSSKC